MKPSFHGLGRTTNKILLQHLHNAAIEVLGKAAIVLGRWVIWTFDRTLPHNFTTLAGLADVTDALDENTFQQSQAASSRRRPCDLPAHTNQWQLA